MTLSEIPLEDLIAEISRRQQVILGFVDDREKHKSWSPITHAVADSFGVQYSALWASGKTGRKTQPRQAAMVLMRQVLRMSLVEIGNVFRNDHGTVIRVEEARRGQAQEVSVHRRQPRQISPQSRQRDRRAILIMQLELPLGTPPPADLVDVARLSGWLYEAGDRWVPARELSTVLELSDRQIRHLAASSGGLVVSSPGSPGYKHVRHRDPDEISAITSRLEHQAKLMGTRAREIRMAFHRAAS
jgi:hypothetical protein